MPIDRFSPEYASTHLGASQVAAAIGVSPYERPIELWETYVGLRARFDGSAASDLGHALEDGVARMAEKRLGLVAATSETLEHPRMSWLCATPDRLMPDGSLLEVKTAGLASYQNREVQDRWGEDGSDEVPMHYVAQCQTQMLVWRAALDASCNLTHLAALIAGRGVVMYRIAYDEGIAKSIVSRAAAFWACVQSNTPPPPDDSEAFAEFLKRRYPASTEKTIEASGTLAEIARTYASANAKLSEAEKEKRAAANQLQTAMADAECLTYDGGKITWKSQQNNSALQPSFWMELSQRIGSEELEKLKAEHTKREGSHRVMRAFQSKGTK